MRRWRLKTVRRKGVTEPMSFDVAIEFVFKREGGLVDDPADPGGLTNFGISQKAYPNEDIRNLTVERAKELYKRDYWLAAGCDRLVPPLDLVHLDTAVNMGVGRARQFLAQTQDPEDYLWLRLDWYRQIVRNRPASGKFLPGWILRMVLLRKEASLVRS